MSKKILFLSIVSLMMIFFTTVEAAQEIVKGSSYILTFNVSGDGEASLTASEGYFSVNMTFGDDYVEYETKDGFEKYNIAEGSYKLVNTSGNVDVYHKGKLAFSYIAPYKKAKNTISVSENGKTISEVEVSYPENKKDYFRTAVTGTSISRTDLNFGVNYDLEFDKVGTKKDTIKIYDGEYQLDVTLGTELTALSVIANDTVSENLGTLPSGEHYYRFSVSCGICQVFIDNEYFASFRMPVSSSVKLLAIGFAESGTTSFIAMKRVGDCYFYETDFSAGGEIEDSAYWSQDIVGDCTYTYLNGLSKNPSFKARVLVDEASQGGVYVLLRYTNENAKVLVGYNFESGVWEIKSTEMSETVNLTKAGTFPKGVWTDLELKADGKRVELWCNGTNVISGNCTFLVTGKTGFMVKNADLQIKNLSYQGESVVIANLSSILMDNMHTADILHLGGNELIMVGNGGSNNLRKSYDMGNSWTIFKNDYIGSNVVKTKEGRIVSIKRIEKAENQYVDCAYISTDNGISFEGPYPVQNDVKDRITMNNKLTLASDGTLFFAANDLRSGVETYGDSKVYYSKDGGVSWTRSKTDISTEVMGINLQEPKIVEMPNGDLRCYVRTDIGFLYYTESKDGGVTWSKTPVRSQFVATCCAFNIERDPYEESTYYITWQYDNTNMNKNVFQFPRSRVALAVSYDGMESFQYIGDIAEYDKSADKDRFANHGIRVLENDIFVTVIQREPSGTEELFNRTRVYKIKKSTIKPLARFSALHPLGTD